MPAPESDDAAEAETLSARINRAVSAGGEELITFLFKSAAPIAAASGRLDVVSDWLRHVPEQRIAHDPQLLYWKGASIVLEHPSEAYPSLRVAFDMLRDKADGHWPLLSWAGLVDSIFLQYRDLRELDPLVEWMTVEREEAVERMPRPLKSLVVGSAMFALAFRSPNHPRMSSWRRRAEQLADLNPTSDLGTRLQVSS